MKAHSFAARAASVLALSLGTLVVLAGVAPAQVTHPPVPPPGSLRGVPIPLPPDLDDFVLDRSTAVALGKALFWEQEAGSDGQACASCHFHAGADDRRKNQIDPGIRNTNGPPLSEVFGPTATGGGGANYTLTANDFPFHQLADPTDRESDVLFDSDDIVSSQGVFRSDFGSVHQHTESCMRGGDHVFQVGGIDVRRVEPRNTPSVFNAIFQFRSFWDGRANNVFNGVTPFGLRDPNATVLEARVDGSTHPVRIALRNAALASQAVGPPLSDFESSCARRSFPDLGAKLLTLRALRNQGIDASDSVLGSRRYWTGKGLSDTYAALIRKAFRPKYWSAGTAQMNSNFSFYWGVSIMLYESTLVSDATRFDRFMEGSATALSASEKNGLQIFLNKGRCITCHKGPDFTGAGSSLQAAARDGGLVEQMIMGDGQVGAYDNGFYNIGVRPTSEDIGVGGLDAFGNPLSFVRQATSGPAVDLFQINPAVFDVNRGIPLPPAIRVVADGSFKVPSLRNVELTGPYMHNGGMATLEQVVDFYNRGGNVRRVGPGDTSGFGANTSNFDVDVQPLHLSDAEKSDLVAFLKSLTDDRVRWEQAPFDHPQLFVPNGHPIDATRVMADSSGDAKDALLEIPAVGSRGRAAKFLPPLKPFLSE